MIGADYLHGRGDRLRSDAGLWSDRSRRALREHPGSPHYADQIDAWSEGELHYIPLKGDIGGVVMILEPK